MIDIKEVKQFKLSNGDEIVCDVVEWPDYDQDVSDIVIRNAFQLIGYGPNKEGISYYQFKPWMVYQDDPAFVQVLNNNHIIAEANPPEELLEQFVRILQENASPEDIKDYADKKLEEYIDKLEAQSLKDEKEEPNIIPFKPKIVH